MDELLFPELSLLTAANEDSVDSYPICLLTPPTSVTQTLPVAEGSRLSYEELLTKHNDLQALYTKLLSEVTKLRSQNEYWTKLYTYVEKGIGIKLGETNKLRKENEQLKENYDKLLNQLREEQAKLVNIPVPSQALKRIQQLEDQVRARDLVIELMKKAEKEKTEKEMQEKLDQQRQQLEQELGIVIGPLPGPEMPTTQPKLLRTYPAGGKRGRPPGRPRTRPPSRTIKVRKRKSISSPPVTRDKMDADLPDEDDLAGKRQESDFGSTEVEGSRGGEADQERMHLEFEDALEELFTDTHSAA